MAVVRCSQGHYYDDEKFSRCPHCGIFTNLKPGAGPEPGHGGKADCDEKTVALSGQPGLSEDYSRTVALESEGVVPSDEQKTVGFYAPGKGNDYVTGWLVCVKGVERGRDYRLHHGFNRIGRGYGMSVCIVDDVHISRENHCAIVYDDRSNTFSLVPMGGNLVYMGGEVITEPITLSAGDVIGIGSSEFEFIAFCREGRVWEKE